MIAALERLRRDGEAALPQQVAALGIAGSKPGWARWFASHPPLDERIAALRGVR